MRPPRSAAALRSSVALAVALPVALDVVAVLMFAALGRRSHAEGWGALGVLATAGPFLAGLAAGWTLTRAWRDPTSLRTGAGVWAGTVALGLLVRGLVLGRLPVGFVAVVAVALGVLLLAWRLLALILTLPRCRAKASGTDRP